MRVRDVEVSYDLLRRWLALNEERPTREFTWITSDAPTDLKIVGVGGHDDLRETIIFRVESATFDDVERDQVPSWRPRYTLHAEPFEGPLKIES